MDVDKSLFKFSKVGGSIRFKDNTASFFLFKIDSENIPVPIKFQDDLEQVIFILIRVAATFSDYFYKPGWSRNCI